MLLQPDNRRLPKDGAPISLRPRAFDLLAARSSSAPGVSSPRTNCSTSLGAAARLREEIGTTLSVHEEREHKRVAATARAALGDDTFDRAWREGGAMGLEEAVRYALNGQAAEGT